MHYVNQLIKQCVEGRQAPVGIEPSTRDGVVGRAITTVAVVLAQRDTMTTQADRAH